MKHLKLPDDCIISCDALPKTILLDASIIYNSPVEGECDLFFHEKHVVKGKKNCALQINIESTITVRNSNMDLKYEDIFLKIILTTKDKDNKTKSITERWPGGQQTGKGEVQAPWNFSKGVEIPEKGNLSIEFICFRVYAHNDGNNDARWEGTFDIINNSKMVITKLA